MIQSVVFLIGCFAIGDYIGIRLGLRLGRWHLRRIEARRSARFKERWIAEVERESGIRRIG